ERRKRVERLIRQNIAVGEEQDARPPRRFSAQIPPAVKQLPRDLKGDERLARASGQREQNAVLPARDGVERALDGDVLKVPRLEIPALVFEGHGGEAVAPDVRLGEGQIPEFFR